MDEVGRQNMAMMERAMSLFSPFFREGEGAGPAAVSPNAGAAATEAPLHDASAPERPARDLEMAALRAEVKSLRGQLADLRPAPLANGATELPRAAPEPARLGPLAPSPVPLPVPLPAPLRAAK